MTQRRERNLAGSGIFAHATTNPEKTPRDHRCPGLEQLIADVRANGGRPSQGPLAGHPLMLLYSIGAKSGQRRRSIVTYPSDPDGYVIAGTNVGNASKSPSWLANINADPNVELEVANETLHATAHELTGPERDRLWTQHVEQLPWFGKYPAQISERSIPVVRLTPKGSTA